MTQQSPVFVKAYDLLRWLLPATARFPKQQRFVLARQIEDAAFAFHGALLAAASAGPAALVEADHQLARLRMYWRLACELRFCSVTQYEHAARLVDELGRLVGGWQRRAAGSETATTAPLGRGVGGGLTSCGADPGTTTRSICGRRTGTTTRHAGQPERQHRGPLRK